MKAAIRVGGIWSALLLGLALTALQQVVQNGPITGFFGIIYLDLFGALMLTVTAFGGLTVTLYSGPFVRYEVEKGHFTPRQGLQYFGWFHLFILIMLLAVSVENLGFMWVAVEATTLVSAVLVGFHNRRTALEAAWKYVILCGVGIALALLGLILLYSAAVKSGLQPSLALNWRNLLNIADRLDEAAVRLAFALVLVGFGTKAGLAPMHNWKPDAYSQAPAPVSALLSGVMLNTALYAVLRVHVIAVRALGPAFPSGLFLAFGLISLGIAVLFILVQRDFKRLLAYSSVEHTGLIAAGIGLGGPVGLYGAILHMIGHSMAKSMLFLAAGNIGHRYHSYRIERVRGVLKTLPVTGVFLAVGGLAITGMPPTSLFLSEFSIVAAGFTSGKLWAVALILVFIAVAFAGMLLHLKEVLSGDVPPGIQAGERFGWESVPLLLLVAGFVVLGLWIPPYLSDIIQQVVALLGGGV